MNILILKPSSLGDVVQALPVLRLLKLRYPKSSIFWWIDSSLAPLLAIDPDLAGIFPFQRKRWASPLHWFEMLNSIREMREKRFDLVVDLQGLARSGTFAWLANGALTVGVDDRREGASGFYDIAVPRPSAKTHAVDWYLSVLKALEIPVHKNFEWIPPHAETNAAIEKLCARAPRWIAINPGARWPNKRWPTEYFSELVKVLADENPTAHFAILGGNDEQSAANAISQSAPERCLNLAGKTTLLELIEWIRHSEFIVTNDTGPMHIAAAMSKPVIPIFGPTNPLRTGPYGQVEHAVRIPLPCSPCMKDVCTYEKPLECMRGISPQFLAKTIQGRFQQTR